MLIRRVVGYERLVGLQAAQLLAELYAALRLFINLFQPSFKLKMPGVNYVGGSRQLRRRVGTPSPCHGRGMATPVFWGWLAGN